MLRQLAPSRALRLPMLTRSPPGPYPQPVESPVLLPPPRVRSPLLGPPPVPLV